MPALPIHRNLVIAAGADNLQYPVANSHTRNERGGSGGISPGVVVRQRA